MTVRLGGFAKYTKEEKQYNRIIQELGRRLSERYADLSDRDYALLYEAYLDVTVQYPNANGAIQAKVIFDKFNLSRDSIDTVCMEWLRKVRYLRERKEKEGYGGEYFIYISYESSKWESGELEKLLQPYPWLPESYINFIKEFDNLGLAFCTFFGSEGIGGIKLAEQIKYFTPLLEQYFFPFGKDASGNLLTIGEDMGVYYFDIFDGSLVDLKKYANSFEEFVGECLMGKRYHEFNIIEGDRYYALLQSLGWT